MDGALGGDSGAHKPRVYALAALHGVRVPREPALGTLRPRRGANLEVVSHRGGVERPCDELVGRAEFYYGQLLTDLSEPGGAQHYLQLALDQLTRSLGERHVMVIEAHTALGRAL